MDSIQDRFFPGMRCFGCGPANEAGLRLKSFAEDGAVRAVFRPWPEHDNGLGFLNGGIIATLLDCHSAAATVVEADLQGWAPLGGAPLPFVTAGLDVAYLRPAPLDGEVSLTARVLEAKEPQIVSAVELWAEGKVRASATATWKRWRPR